MNKYFLLFSCLILLLVGRYIIEDYGSVKTSRSSFIKVVDKRASSAHSEFWIEAIDTNNKNEPFKIIVQEPMVWNLIKNKEEYFITCFKTGEGPWLLLQINYPNDESTAR